jgi:hypothetical protein
MIHPYYAFLEPSSNRIQRKVFDMPYFNLSLTQILNIYWLSSGKCSRSSIEPCTHNIETQSANYWNRT